MNQLMRRVAMSLALPLAVGTPAVLLAAPAEATMPTVTVSAPGSIVYGQPLRATADVTAGGNAVTEGTVQFRLHAPGESGFHDFGPKVPVDSTGHAVSPLLTQDDGHPFDVTEG